MTNDFAVGIDFFAKLMYNAGMSKTILSVFILGLTIVLSIILFFLVRENHPEWGSFYSLLYMGLIVFGLGVGLFVSGLLLEKSIKQLK